MSPLSIPGKVTLKQSHDADPYYGAVSLLLHGDGADGSTQIIDSSVNPKTVTAVGNARISTAQSKFGGASMYFDGSGDKASLSASPEWVFGIQDFTIEAWMYLMNGGQSYARLMHFGPFWLNDNAWGINAYDADFPGKLTFASFKLGGRLCVSTSTIALNTWYHIAVTRQNGVFRLFVNGILESTNSSYISDTIEPVGATTNTFTVGSSATTSGGEDMQGYIDDLRITKGVARYTSNFTPPTQPFFNNFKTGADQHFYSTSLLLKGDGTNGSTNIVDSSYDPKTITVNGDAQISTAQSKFGGSSIAFDGAGDYISTPNNAAFDYGTSNFTIEFWYKFAATPGADQYIYSQRLDSNNFVYIYATSSSFVLYKLDGFGSLTLTGSTTHNTTTWSHLAAVRNGTTFTLYKDGTALNSITNNATFASLGVQLDIGIWSGPSPSLAFNGYIDDLRITKGIARYTSNFTPPGSLPTY